MGSTWSLLLLLILLAQFPIRFIAYAKAHGHTVVSHEVYVEGERKRVKIPAVCNSLDVPYIRTFQMLREAEARFVLSSE